MNNEPNPEENPEPVVDETPVEPERKPAGFWGRSMWGESSWNTPKEKVNADG